MFIAKVVGSTWATTKVPELNGLKMLLIRQIDPVSTEFSGKVMMAVDSKIGAGIGDTVLVIDEGGSARQSLELKNGPIRTAIVGIVDEVCAYGKVTKFH